MSAFSQIQLIGLSKRFRGEWLFKSIDYGFKPTDRISILGPNGSGKSTFLKIISGYMAPTEGSVEWQTSSNVEVEHWHKLYSYCAPYQEYIEEFTLRESIDFHFSLKTQREIDLQSWLGETKLAGHMNKRISRFSSGMKQRLKLILTLATASSVYFLDEPCSNLDEDGVTWYSKRVRELPVESIVLIASNSPKEYEICTQQIHIDQF